MQSLSTASVACTPNAYWTGPNTCSVEFYDVPCAKMTYNVSMTSLPFTSASSGRDTATTACYMSASGQGDADGLYQHPSSSYCHPSSQMQLCEDAAVRYASLQDAASDCGLGNTIDKRQKEVDGLGGGGPIGESNSIRRSVMATARERHRTMNVNAAFSILRTLIPTEPADRRLSKIETLRLASSYISHLHAALAADVRCDQQPCHVTRRAVTSSCNVMRVEEQQQGAVICTFCLSAAKTRVSVPGSGTRR